MTGPATIAFHIGAHKTATTHLQQTLRANAALLAAHRVRALTPRELRGPGRSLPARLRLGATPPGADGALDRLAAGHPRLVLSEENFAGPVRAEAGGPLYPDAPARLAAFTRAVAPVPVEVFLGVRDPASFTASLYGQALLGGAAPSLAEYLGRHPLESVDWAELVGRLAAVDGVARVQVWRHEDYSHLCGAIVAELAAAPVGGRVRVPRRRAHVGLSARAVEAVLACADPAIRAQTAAEARRRWPAGARHPKFAPFSEAERARSARAYAAQIAAIDRLAAAPLRAG